MTLELQLRSLAEAASAEQEPVTAEEAMARATEVDALVDPPRRRSWLLVAASIALVIGGLSGVFALTGSRDDREPRVPAPETVAPDTTVPATTTPDTTPPTSAAPTTVTNEAPRTEALVNEPTLDYREGVDWWAPGQLPAGWGYGYATDDGIRTIRLFDEDRSTIDIEFGADPASIDGLADATTEQLGGEAWQVFEDGMARQVDGVLLAVLGPVEPARTVAAGLQLVAETDLVRPPFRADAEPGPVVLTLTAEEVGGAEPFELRAHTDGLFTSVGGDIKRVSADDPVGFGTYVYDDSAGPDPVRVVITGFAFDGVDDKITFGLIDGGAADVVARDSDRFAEDFYALVVDLPAAVVGQYEQGTLERLTRWTLTHVEGEQRVYDEPGAQNCVDCEDFAGSGEPGPPPSPSGDAPPLGFEPTNVYRDEMWWLPAEVPEGYVFAYAVERWGVLGDRTATYRSTGEAGSSLSISQRSAADAGEPTEPTEQEQIGDVTWSWRGDVTDSGVLSRVVGDSVVEVRGPRQSAIAAAATLDLVPESELERPPFRLWDPSAAAASLVVAVAPDDADRSASVPTELRVSTDGVHLSLNDGFPEPVWSDRPLEVRGDGMSCDADGRCIARVFGIALPEVATVEFELLSGEVITVVPEDRSGHFGVGFFIVVVEFERPAGDDVVSVVQSAIARDADGDVVAAISEPV